jgi:hypothetical protein
MSYKDTIKEYIPASCEKYIVEHAEKLGYGSTKVWTTDEHGLDLARGCAIWSDPKISNEEVYNSLHSYLSDLDKYNEAMKNFEPIPDLFDEIREGNYDACLSASYPYQNLDMWNLSLLLCVAIKGCALQA